MDGHYPGSPLLSSSSSHLAFRYPDRSGTTFRHSHAARHQGKIVSPQGKANPILTMVGPAVMDKISRQMVKVSTTLSPKDRSIQPRWLQESNSYGCSSALKRTFRPQCTALSIGPARTPPRDPHYSALSFDFDALALGPLHHLI